MSMKEKILKAFKEYKAGIRPSNFGSARYAFVLNNEDQELYPVKIIWALANEYDSTASFNTREAAKELEKYGFISIDSNTGLIYPASKDNLDEKVKNALNEKPEIRAQKLAHNKTKPNKRTVEILQFERNPYVIAEVLIRANGICEECKNKAPFIRKSDNTPYLEVHHIIPLSENGDDTVENCIALCPNCHRKAHFG